MSVVADHGIERGVRFEIELRRRGRAAMASEAIFGDERLDGLRKLLIQRRTGGVSAGNGANGHNSGGPSQKAWDSAT